MRADARVRVEGAMGGVPFASSALQGPWLLQARGHPQRAEAATLDAVAAAFRRKRERSGSGERLSRTYGAKAAKDAEPGCSRDCRQHQSTEHELQARLITRSCGT